MYINQAHSNMLKQQIRAWDILDPTILSLFEQLPREEFVPTAYKELAYADIFIPLPHGMFMPTPKEEAKILQALKLTNTEKVLEIGTGSGYFTALLAKLAQKVYSADLNADRMMQVEQKLFSNHLHNVVMLENMSEYILGRYAPYDVIVVNGSIPFLHYNLRSMLLENGRVFAVVGNAPVMEATIFSCESGQGWRTEKIFETLWPRLPGIEEFTKFVF